MNAVAVIFALAAGALHIGVGISEAFFFTRRGVQQFLLKKDASPPEVRLWAFSQGFYNMFLGAGAIIGAALAGSNEDVGRALVLYTCSFMALCGIVLYVSDHRLWGGAVAQFTIPAVAVVATLA